MIGTIINIAAITLGSFIGILAHSRMPQRFSTIVFQALGLVTAAIGVAMSLKSDNLILAVVSVVSGALIGEYIKIEQRLERCAETIKVKLKAEKGNFTEGVVTASMIFCVGSMTILGSIEEGLGMEPKLLLTKSLMDGVAAVALSATFGIGVLLSIIPVFIYQGLITLFASYLSKIMSEQMICDLTSVGGILLIGLAINILGIKKVGAINMLPGLIIIIVLSYFFG